MNTVTDMRNPTKRFVPNRNDSLLVRLLVFMSILFALLPSGFRWGEPDPNTNYAQGSILVQLQFGSVFLLGAWLAWRNFDWSLSHARRVNPFLIVLIGYCFLSTIWSPYPVVTIKHSIQLVGLVLVGIAVAPPVGGKQEMLRTLLVTLMLLLVISMPVSLLIPSIGVDYELGGAWQGILPQKNAMGAISGLCVMLWLKEGSNNTIPRVICFLAILFSAFMLVMAKSSTAILVTAIGSAFYLLLRRRILAGESDGIRMLLIAFVAVLAGLHFFYVFEARLPDPDEVIAPITALFHKGTDLTGRTDIWYLVLQEIARHPLQGIGYGAFWLGQGSPSQYIIDALHWIPLQAHNGYLDIVNELGLIGLTIVLLVFSWHIWQLARLMRVDREEAAIHWAIFLLILVSNSSESELFRGLMFQNIFFIYSSTQISARLNLARWERLQATQSVTEAATTDKVLP
jgi:exopolysaccharide production protein ExoQ